MRIALPDAAKKALGMLASAGYKSYVVGGAVRDALLGRETHDYDIATSALPAEVKRVFRGYRLGEVGAAHGTIEVRIDGLRLEVTTFRQDGGYSDGRHPDSVSFSRELESDLARRDFTINAMAYNEQDGLVDQFGGQADLGAKLVRAVGDATVRFEEDALRILRLARFCASLDFEPEHTTEQAALALRGRLALLSAERVRDELSGFLVQPRAGALFLRFKALWFEVIPELIASDGFDQHNPNHHLDVLGHTASVVDNTPPQLALRLAALLHDVAKPGCFSLDENGRGHFYGHMRASADVAENILKRLRYPNAVIDDAVKLISLHNIPRDDSMRCALTWLRYVGPRLAYDLVDLVKADYLAHDPSYAANADMLDRLREKIDEALREGLCYSIAQLKIGGGDLVRLGVKRGPAVGKALAQLLTRVIAGELKNNRRELLAAARELAKAPPQ